MRIILMDGECTFCQASVQFIMKRDSGLFRFASLQSEIGQHYIKRFELQGIDSVVLIEHDQAYVYSEAALRIARQLNAPWCYLRLARIMPRLFRDLAYRLIAKNRHYLLKNDRVCSLPTEKDRARFLA